MVPNSKPLIVTVVPTAAADGETPEMLTPVVKTTPLLAIPFTVTITGPVVAPDGTGTAILVALQDVGVAETPLNVTVLVPCVERKFAPVIVTDVPTAPEVGVRVLMIGAGKKTVKFTPLLATPLAFTMTFPVVAPDGTVAEILPAAQLVTEAVAPLKVTLPLPCDDPKLDPEIVTEVPIAPEVGERLVMLGGGTTVKLTALLACPPTVTTTFPVVAPLGTGTAMLVALQLVGVAVVPLNFTVLLPCVGPNVVPLIVTEAPTAPDVGERLLIWGMTVKLTPLLATPDTVTTTFPVVAPLGTGTTILVELQLVGVPAVPLNLTVLLPCDAPKFFPLTVTDVPPDPDVGDKLVILGPAA